PTPSLAGARCSAPAGAPVARLTDPTAQVVVADDDPRSILRNVILSSDTPALNHRRLLRRDLRRSFGPSLNQLTLQRVHLCWERPVARLARHDVSRRGKAALRSIDGVRSGRSADSLVVRPLMPVHPLAYRVVLGLDRPALRAAVVGQREQDGSARGTTPFGKIAEPALGHEIQQCRRGDE